jgi:hypothetical protein
MKFSALGLFGALAASIMAEDVLFVDTFQYVEYTETLNTLGLSAKVVTVDQWNAMTTADFAAFKSIVLSDPDCAGDTTDIQFLVDSKDVWGPAVQGNIVLIGVFPLSCCLSVTDSSKVPIQPSTHLLVPLEPQLLSIMPSNSPQLASLHLELFRPDSTSLSRAITTTLTALQ